MEITANIHQDLIDKCKYGNRSAQFELYKLYSKAMLNTSFRIVNDEADAEDILQESFVSAFKNIHSYREEATFGAWLKRIVINKSISLINKRKLELSPIEEAPEMANDADAPVDRSMEVSRIKEAMKLLPDGFRMVFSLYMLEGYDHKEIGEILGISESTSKSQLNRAKAKLRELLNDKVYE